ncbi:MAG: restriction endonuclease subunit S [Ignavibacteriae bacterium]|nr:restriction endonuclease subunit S [Ignavibacteriota bacterium]MCB9215205.1 restriction endonuclease subunit S [Ignavibacteria bacterium]
MKKGWEMKMLGDVLEKTETTNPARLPQNEFNYIDVSSVSNETLTIQETQYLKGEDAPSRARRLVKANDVLFATIRPTLRRIAIVPEELDNQVCSTGYCVLRARPDIDPRFVFYFLQTEDFMSAMETLQKGTSYPAVTDGDVRLQPIPIPPLTEQHRIVRLLDEAFEGLATAKANAEKNLQNARALFESHLQSVFAQRGEGWVERQLASLCNEITVGHVGSMKTKYMESGIPFLRSQNIRPFEVSMENAMFIDETFHHALKKSQLSPGDLAIVRTGYPGTAAVIPPELPDSNCSDLVIVRPSNEVNPHFLAAFFNSAFGKKLVLGKIVGAAQKHFNITAAKEVMLYVPPIPEQLAIIAQSDEIRNETQHLTRIYEQKVAALEELKKSLLHQAFSGEL